MSDDKDEQKGTGGQGLMGNASYISNVSEFSAVSLEQKPQLSGGEPVWKTFSSRVLCRYERVRLRALACLFTKGFFFFLSFIFARGEAIGTHLRLEF